MGWCYINKGKWREALNDFQKSVESTNKVAGQFKPSDLKATDMREEGLRSQAFWPFSELKPEEVVKIPKAGNPVEFYRGLSPDKFVYARVMNRLGRRFGWV